MKKMITLGFIACVSLTSSTTFGMLARQLQSHRKKLISHKKYTNSADIVFMQVLTRIEQQNVLLTHQLAATRELNKKLDMFIDNMIIDNMVIDNITKTLKKQQNDSSNKLEEMKPPLSIMSKYDKEVDAYYKQKETPKKE